MRVSHTLLSPMASPFLQCHFILLSSSTDRSQWQSLWISIKSALGYKEASAQSPPRDKAADDTESDAAPAALSTSGVLRRRFSYPKRAFDSSNGGGEADRYHRVGDGKEESKVVEAQEALIEKMDGGDRETVGRSELAYAERFFRHLYGDAVVHLQPVYPFHVVSGKGEESFL